MHTYKLAFYFCLMMVTLSLFGTQDADVSQALRGLALHDAACGAAADAPGSDVPTLATLPIRVGTHELGAIVTVHGSCHCRGPNCDALVYLRQGEQYKLELHEKYASLHPMKIVKRGMPSLTGQFEIGAAKMETTVYDWDGKSYRPSLCATVTKNRKVPAIARHPCRTAPQIDDRAQ
ncbi:MAG TPA: hypothetical protein VFR84_06265 [Candidatus Angelobacter sp.]|nr:hypothetical protein [Candidatus Angelobacter sp.]